MLKNHLRKCLIVDVFVPKIKGSLKTFSHYTLQQSGILLPLNLKANSVIYNTYIQNYLQFEL